MKSFVMYSIEKREINTWRLKIDFFSDHFDQIRVVLVNCWNRIYKLNVQRYIKLKYHIDGLLGEGEYNIATTYLYL